MKGVVIYDINGYLPVAQTTDDELYNLIEKKLYDVYEEEVYVESNYNEAKYVLKINLNDNSILAGDKDTNYKLKYSFGDYLLTTDNYLFKISDEKLISNNKVKSISVDDLNVDDVLNMHILYVTYENGEKTKLFDVY